MIVARFSVRCRPERTQEVAAAMNDLERSSRELPGVIHFDVARSLSDPNTLFTFEVFEDHDALARSETQDQVATVMRLLESGAHVEDPEWTTWEVSPSM